jgi:hypothetical protein
MDDSVELPVKKGKQSDTRMITALKLRYRAIQATDKSVIDGSTYWLIQGGYTEEDKKSLVPRHDARALQISPDFRSTRNAQITRCITMIHLQTTL